MTRIGPVAAVVLAVAAVPALLATLHAQPLAAPNDETILDLLKRIPAFAATSGRSGLQLTDKKMTLPGPESGKAYFVEFRWNERGVTHTGLAVLAHKSVGDDKPWVVKGDPWGVGMMIEDKDWAFLVSDLKRAQTRDHELATKLEIRKVIIAQAKFQSASGGWYGEMRCLVRPTECIPGFTGLHFLEEELASAVEKNGYRRQFHPGPRRAGDPSKPASSPLLKAFAYTAVPSRVGESGQRSFCGDSSGRVCVLASGAAPVVTAGACPASCPER
jgi:hypothetical protein